jgi:hypothetical protein
MISIFYRVLCFTTHLTNTSSLKITAAYCTCQGWRKPAVECAAGYPLQPPFYISYCITFPQGIPFVPRKRGMGWGMVQSWGGAWSSGRGGAWSSVGVGHGPVSGWGMVQWTKRLTAVRWPWVQIPGPASPPHPQNGVIQGG